MNHELILFIVLFGGFLGWGLWEKSKLKWYDPQKLRCFIGGQEIEGYYDPGAEFSFDPAKPGSDETVRTFRFVAPEDQKNCPRCGEPTSWGHTPTCDFSTDKGPCNCERQPMACGHCMTFEVVETNEDRETPGHCVTHNRDFERIDDPDEPYREFKHFGCPMCYLNSKMELQ